MGFFCPRLGAPSTSVATLRPETREFVRSMFVSHVRRDLRLNGLSPHTPLPDIEPTSELRAHDDKPP